MRKELNNFYYKSLVRALKEEQLYNDKVGKKLLKIMLKSIEGELFEEPHIICRNSYNLYITYINLIIDTYVSHIVYGIAEHEKLNEELINKEQIKSAIILCRLYQHCRIKYGITTITMENIIKKQCYNYG